MFEVVLVTLAGVAAGVINTAVGSGSLVTYPALLLAGMPPVLANVTNTVGLAPGALGGAWAYRAELRGQRRGMALLVPISIVGAIGGAALLLTLPAAAFKLVVPVLIMFAAVLVAVPPLLARVRTGAQRDRWVPLGISVGAASVYGGYFSAAQGIILLGVLGLFQGSTNLQDQNAMKNVLQALVNVVAAIFFLFTVSVNLKFAACVAVGSLIGAPLGAALARRLPPAIFRGFVVVFGLGVGIYLFITR